MPSSRILQEMLEPPSDQHDWLLRAPYQSSAVPACPNRTMSFGLADLTLVSISS
jgi:hypothetical protein